jgi:hypothetical protein
MTLPEATHGARRRHMDATSLKGTLNLFTVAEAIDATYQPRRAVIETAERLTSAELTARLPEDLEVADQAREAFAQLWDAAAFLQQDLAALTYSAEFDDAADDLAAAIFFIDHAQQRVPEIARTADRLIPGQPVQSRHRSAIQTGLQSPQPNDLAQGGLGVVQRIAFGVRSLQHAVVHAVERLSDYEDELDFLPRRVRSERPTQPEAARVAPKRPALPVAPKDASQAQEIAYQAAREIIEMQRRLGDGRPSREVVSEHLYSGEHLTAATQRSSLIGATLATVKNYYDGGRKNFPTAAPDASPAQREVADRAAELIREFSGTGRQPTYDAVVEKFPETELDRQAITDAESLLSATEAIVRDHYDQRDLMEAERIAAVTKQTETGRRPAAFGAQDLRGDLRDIVDDLANAGQHLNQVLGGNYAVEIYVPEPEIETSAHRGSDNNLQTI